MEDRQLSDLLERRLVGERSVRDEQRAAAGFDPLAKRCEQRKGRAEIDLHAAPMEGRIHEREVEATLQRFFPRIPPGDLAALTEAEPLDIRSSTLDCTGVRVSEQDAGLGPEHRRRDAENARAAAEIDDSFGRLVSDEAGQGVEQELAAGVELLRAEDARAGFELKLDSLMVDRFDRGGKVGVDSPRGPSPLSFLKRATRARARFATMTGV